jgi:hypothetical protein
MPQGQVRHLGFALGRPIFERTSHDQTVSCSRVHGGKLVNRHPNGDAGFRWDEGRASGPFQSHVIPDFGRDRKGAGCPGSQHWKERGGQILVESLVALGVSKGFGVPGESYLAVLDALHDTHGRVDFVLCRNEGGAAFMAAAYGKLTGQPGLCFVTRGPGVTNASIGVHTAMQDSAPMIIFVGQVGTDMRGREAFQEIDYRAVFGTMAKWAVEIDDVNRLPEILARAWGARGRLSLPCPKTC